MTGTEELSASLRGEVLAQPGFQPFNPAFPVRPAALVAPIDIHDVVTAVSWAARNGMPVRVMATGHGLGGPVDGGVLITTEQLGGVTVDPDRRTAAFGAGVRWGQVIEAAAPHGLAPVNGSSSGVGAVGYTLGGGTGPLSRAYGFSADHVVRALLVDGSGAVHEVDDRDRELFWALRGGKGNFGVVTELEIELMPVDQSFAGFTVARR